MTTWTTIAVALLGFNLLVVVHELGHYLVARWCGMRVLRFSIGLGPPLVRFVGRETTVQLALFPIGGFVHVAGMEGRDTGPGTYLGASLPRRAAMVAAGPLFNLALAALIFAYLFGTLSALTTPPVGSNVVRAVDGPAKAAGLRPGDTIVAVDGQPARYQRDVNRLVGAAQGEGGETRPVRITVVRPPAGERPAYVDEDIGEWEAGLWRRVPRPDPSWERLTFEIVPERLGPDRVRLGVVFDLLTIGARSPAKIAELAAYKTWFYVEAGARLLARMVTGRQAPEFSSVVGITQVGADTLRIGGPSWYLNLLALLSVSLFLLNLIPLPPLDGGRLAFVLVEAVARRPVPRRVQTVIQGAGFLVLLALILVATVKDVIEVF